MEEICLKLEGSRDRVQSFDLEVEGRCRWVALREKDRSGERDRSWAAVATEGRSARPWRVRVGGRDGDWREGVGVEKDVLSFLQIWVTLTPGGEWAATVPPSTTSRPQMV